MTFLPGPSGAESAGREQIEIRHAVTYIANEFLENAMKYHERTVDIPIEIRLELTSDNIRVSATNGVNPAQAERYREFIDSILLQDVDDLLLRQMEAGSTSSDSNESCLGLVTMISDYGAKLGWHFASAPAGAGVFTVTTSALLPLSNLSGLRA
jgi:hypothetical protein